MMVHWHPLLRELTVYIIDGICELKSCLSSFNSVAFNRSHLSISDFYNLLRLASFQVSRRSSDFRSVFASTKEQELSEPPKRPERFRKRFSEVSPICSRKRFRFVFSTFRFTFPIRFRRSGVFSTFPGNTFPIRFQYVSNTFPSFRPGGKNANRRKRFQYVFFLFWVQ